MKWIVSALLATSITLAIPSFVMAQPGPGPMGGPGMGPMHGNGHGQGYGHNQHKKKKDKDRDDYRGYDHQPGMVPPPHPAPVPPPHPAPAPRPAPVAHPRPAPVPPPPPIVSPVPAPPPSVYHPVTVLVSEPVYAPVVRAMHPRDFRNLVRSIEHATFSDDKLMIIRSARLNNFTSDQVRDILRRLDFDSERIDAAVMLYPRVVDRSNWFIIYDTLDYASSRREIEHQIRF